MMKRKRNNKSGRLNRKQTRSSRRVRDTGVRVIRRGPNFPPDMRQMPIQCRKIRYITTNITGSQGGSGQSLTMKDLLQSIAQTVATSTTVYSIFSSVRLRRISLFWAPTNNFDTIANTLSFMFVGMGVPEEQITDRGTGTEPACLKMQVPQQSYLNQFFDLSTPNLTTTYAYVWAPAGTIIDYEFEYVVGGYEGVSNNFTVSTTAPISQVAILTLYHGGPAWVPDGGVYTIF